MHHFLKETDFTLDQAQAIFKLACAFKKDRNNCSDALFQQSWGLLFYKSSTRTRISFEVGVNELGGFPVVLNTDQTQINRGESLADTAKVMSRYLQGLVIRSYGHEIVETFAAEGNIPIINGLTDFNHPCQLYTDLFSILERYSPDSMDIAHLKGKKIAFFGDCASNMANSWILCAAYFGMQIVLSGPQEFSPTEKVQKVLKNQQLPIEFTFTKNTESAAKDADILYTDVWVSMGDEEEAQTRRSIMRPYQVTEELMALAKEDALFMHCLPAHPGEEVSQAVLDSPQSIIFDQAENRLHTQKAIIAQLVKMNLPTYQ